jgi:hypothetical protein
MARNLGQHLGLIVWLILLGACKPAPSVHTVTDPKTGEKMQVSVQDGTEEKAVSVVTTSGGGTVSIGQDGKAPTNVPAFIPAYPGGTYSGSFAAASKAGANAEAVSSGMVGFTSSDPADKIIGFYSAAFEKAGLKQTARGTLGEVEMLSYSNSDDETQGVQVMISKAAKTGSEVQILYSWQPN